MAICKHITQVQSDSEIALKFNKLWVQVGSDGLGFYELAMLQSGSGGCCYINGVSAPDAYAYFRYIIS